MPHVVSLRNNCVICFVCWLTNCFAMIITATLITFSKKIPLINIINSSNTPIMFVSATNVCVTEYERLHRRTPQAFSSCSCRVTMWVVSAGHTWLKKCERLYQGISRRRRLMPGVAHAQRASWECIRRPAVMIIIITIIQYNHTSMYTR